MEKQNEDLKAIREMMEKSTKFLTLSGLSGVSAGIIALLGAIFAHFYMAKNIINNPNYSLKDLLVLVFVSLAVLLLSFVAAAYFSAKNAKKKNQKLVKKATLYSLYNLAIPLTVGGVLSFIMLLRGNYEFIAATTLIFYGLSLVNASKYTFEEVHYLGITEIIIGILAAIFISHGLLFWTLGFGVCHILYGLIMYNKYDRK